MNRQLFLIFLTAIVLPAATAHGNGKGFTTLWSGVELASEADVEKPTASFDFGFLQPLLECFLGDRMVAPESADSEPPTPDLAYDEWVSDYAEDCGPQQSYGARLVLEYSFDF